MNREVNDNGAEQRGDCSTCAARTRRRSTIAGPTSLGRDVCCRRARAPDRARSRTAPTRRIRPTRTPARAQPKFDVRVDYDFPDAAQKLQFVGRRRRHRRRDAHRHRPVRHRHAAREMGYWKVNYTKNALPRAGVHEHPDGDADNLVSVDADGAADRARLRHQDVRRRSRRHAAALARKHVLTYGGNLRINRFDLTHRAGEDGAHRGRRLRAGRDAARRPSSASWPARASTSSARSTTPCSRRASRCVFKPAPDQSVRVSYNRAFRAPSMVNNNLETTIATPLPLGAINPAFGSAVFHVPTTAIGQPGPDRGAHRRRSRSPTRQTSGIAPTSRRRSTTTTFSEQIFFTQTGTWLTPPPGISRRSPSPA